VSVTKKKLKAIEVIFFPPFRSPPTNELQAGYVSGDTSQPSLTFGRKTIIAFEVMAIVSKNAFSA
jgi:hypothetical protein